MYWRDIDASVLRLYTNALCSLKGPLEPRPIREAHRHRCGCVG
jgi:hypothetical protein